MKTEHFIKLAIRTAFQSKSEFRHGAVLVKRNAVISIAINIMNKTHPLQQKYSRKKFSIGSHAETRCCLGIPYSELNKSTLFVARILKNGTPALSKPCIGCQEILIELGVRKVFYTINSQDVNYLLL